MRQLRPLHTDMPALATQTGALDALAPERGPAEPGRRLPRAWRAARMGLRTFAERLLQPDNRYGRAFENLILALIVLSLVSVILESNAGLPPWARRAFHVEELVVVAVFSFEYLLRLAMAERKLSFIFSFYGLVDLLAIAPYFLAGIDARAARALRLLRLVRVLKLQTHLLENTVAERTRELSDKNVALEQAQAQLQAELEVARALQLAILPASFPAKPGCDGAARMIPATSMGGDFYDFIELPDGRIGLVMADVSGKGVPAAFFMAVTRTQLRELAARCATPGECLARTNDVLCGQNPLDLFVTVFYGVFDPADGTLRYANAGHNAPFVRRADGSVEVLAGAVGLMLGVMPGMSYPDHGLQLRPGDRVVLYTDGITEAFSDAEQAFGTERLLAEVSAHGDGAAAALVERICGSVSRFAGNAPQSDDITLTVLVWGAP